MWVVLEAQFLTPDSLITDKAAPSQPRLNLKHTRRLFLRDTRSIRSRSIRRAFFFFLVLGDIPVIRITAPCPGPIVPRTRALETGHPTQKRAAAIALQIEERGANSRLSTAMRLLRPGAGCYRGGHHSTSNGWNVGGWGGGSRHGSRFTTLCALSVLVIASSPLLIFGSRDPPFHSPSDIGAIEDTYQL